MYSSVRAALRLTVPLIAILVVVSSLLIALRIEQLLLDVAQARSLRAAHELSARVEEGFRLAMTLADQHQLARHLQRQRDQDGSMTGARVLGDSGVVVAELGDPAAFGRLNPAWTQQLLAQGEHAGAPVPWIVRGDGVDSYAGMAVLDSSARPAAVVWLAYDRAELLRSALLVLKQMWLSALGIGLALLLALTVLAAVWMRTARTRLAAAQASLAGDSKETIARDPLEVVRAVDGIDTRHRRLWNELLLLLMAICLTCTALTALAWQAREIARPLLLEQIDHSARSVLQFARSQINHALALGIPPEKLSGLNEMFQADLESAPEIAFLALQRTGGETSLSPSRDNDVKTADATRQWLEGNATPGLFRIASEPLQFNGRTIGRLVAGTPSDYVDDRMRSVLLDLLLAVIVSLVLVREALGAAWERSALRPYLAFETLWQGWRRGAVRLSARLTPVQRLDWLTEAREAVTRLSAEAATYLRSARLAGLDRELVRIRLAVFLTAMSDELLRPFFAVFSSEAAPLPFALSATMLAGLPLAAFMLTLAVAQPLGPWITSRVDVRRALVWASLTGAALVAATAYTRDSAMLILLRAGSGAIYGLILILAQTIIVRVTGPRQRARGLVEVPAAIVSAGVCGPVLGGLIVERIGTTAAFMACAACLVAAAWACRGLVRLPDHARGNLNGLGGWRGMAVVLRHPRVMAMTWFSAVPARLAAAALLVVVTPLYLVEIGESSAVSGRVQLLYFLVFMIAAPIAARWSDASRRRSPWIVLGCAVSALACAAMPLWGGVAGMAVCCALLGLGQAMLSAPQLALVTESFDREAQATQFVNTTPEQALAAYRFIERFGSVLAPFAAALAVGGFGLAGAVSAIGVVLALGAIGVAVALFETRNSGESHALA
ncbi:MAG: MFS transporter [Ramlibacter sp.]